MNQIKNKDILWGLPEKVEFCKKCVISFPIQYCFFESVNSKEYNFYDKKVTADHTVQSKRKALNKKISLFEDTSFCIKKSLVDLKSSYPFQEDNALHQALKEAGENAANLTPTDLSILFLSKFYDDRHKEIITKLAQKNEIDNFSSLHCLKYKNMCNEYVNDIEKDFDL